MLRSRSDRGPWSKIVPVRRALVLILAGMTRRCRLLDRSGLLYIFNESDLDNFCRGHPAIPAGGNAIGNVRELLKLHQYGKRAQYECHERYGFQNFDSIVWIQRVDLACPPVPISLQHLDDLSSFHHRLAKKVGALVGLESRENLGKFVRGNKIKGVVKLSTVSQKHVHLDGRRWILLVMQRRTSTQRICR